MDSRGQTRQDRICTLTTCEQATAMLEYQASEADTRADALHASFEQQIASLDTTDPEALLRALDAELVSLTVSEAETVAKMRALSTEADSEVERAAKAVELAREATEAANAAMNEVREALEAGRAELNARIGQHRESSAQFRALDQEKAVELVRQRERELFTIPADATVTEVEVQNAEVSFANANHRLDEVKEALHKSEGALLTVGGSAIAEEARRIEEALTVARSREKDLEVEADAWKLLLDTLRTVENEEGAHLGRALAGPITSKFAELTAGRYKGLRLDPTLKTESIDVTAVANAPDALGALSVGTRNQLATLIRLTIAAQLRSAIILDDHLVHTDARRLAWFRDTLMKTALDTQVIVLTCRPEDYLAREEIPVGVTTRDLAGGTLRAIEVAGLMKRWTIAPPARGFPTLHADGG